MPSSGGPSPSPLLARAPARGESEPAAVDLAGGDLVPLTLITALAAVLRLYRLEHQSLWMDEVLTVLSSHTSLYNVLFDPPVDPNVPPLYYLLMAVLQGFGASETALRLPSVVVGVLSVPLLYAVARVWLGPGAVLAALLAAVSPLHVWYSQEARPYAFLIFLGLLSVRFFQLALRDPTSRGARAGFAVTAAATFYVHTVAIAFVAALALAVLLVVPRREWRPWLVTFAAVAVLALPGAYLLLRIPPTVSANPFYVFNPAHLAYTLWTFAVGYSLGPNLIELRTDGFGSVRRSLELILPVLTLVGGLLGLGILHLWRIRREALAFLLPWTLAPIAFVVLGTWVTSHPYNVRYTLLALPPVLILVAAGIDALRPPGLRRTAAALVLVLSAASLGSYYADPKYARDDNRGAAAYIRAAAAPAELVIVSAAYTRVPLRHYLGDTPVRLVGYPADQAGTADREGGLGARFVQSDRLEADFRELIGERRSFWLFLSRTFHSDPRGELRRHAERNYEPVARYLGPGVEAIRYVRPERPLTPP